MSSATLGGIFLGILIAFLLWRIYAAGFKDGWQFTTKKEGDAPPPDDGGEESRNPEGQRTKAKSKTKARVIQGKWRKVSGE
jgi:hypothetical protein